MHFLGKLEKIICKSKFIPQRLVLSLSSWFECQFCLYTYLHALIAEAVPLICIRIPMMWEIPCFLVKWRLSISTHYKYVSYYWYKSSVFIQYVEWKVINDCRDNQFKSRELALDFPPLPSPPSLLLKFHEF